MRSRQWPIIATNQINTTMATTRKHRFPLDEEEVARIKFGDYLIGEFESWMGVPVCTSARTLSGEPLICSVYPGDGPSTQVFEFDILTTVIEWDAGTQTMIVKSCWDSDDYDLMDVISSV